MKEIFKKILLEWQRFIQIFGKVNSFIILTLFYFLIIGPVALIRKLIKFLHPKTYLDSYWIPKREENLSNFKEQF